jgi:hypothetical protein
MILEPASKRVRDRILAAMPRPLTEIGTKALESFLDLPFVEDWNPKNMHGAELSHVFDVGLPFSFLVGNTTAEAHRRNSARQRAGVNCRDPAFQAKSTLVPYSATGCQCEIRAAPSVSNRRYRSYLER